MSALLWQCQDWQDWESLAKLYDIEHQWPQAVSCSLNVLVQTKNQENVKRRAPSLVEHYIQSALLFLHVECMPYSIAIYIVIFLGGVYYYV